MVEEFNVQYLDDDIIVAEKPNGLLSIPDGYNPSLPNLLTMLTEEYGRIIPVHRLDKDTSGVVIFARNAMAHRYLNMQFQKRQILKIYLAWVEGVPDWNELTIDICLRVNADRKHRTLPDINSGKCAQTIINVIESNQLSSLVIARPKNGYTHQIRSHLAAVQHPILFDALYNPAYKPVPGIKQNTPDRRLMLHAYRLQFVHPATHAPAVFFSAIPRDFIIPKISQDQIDNFLAQFE